MLPPDLREKIVRWTGPAFSSETRAEVTSLLARADGGDASAIDDARERFLLDLKFGTGGLRAKMGLGTNRMNVYTLRKAAQGVVSYVVKANPGARAGQLKAALSCDSRINSRLFTREAASVFAANGVLTYVFADTRPTPMLSFATRHFGCVLGAMVTASHNPKEYNGFKVYAGSGAQVMGALADGMIASVNATSFDAIRSGDYDTLRQAGMIVELGPEMDETYLEAIRPARLCEELVAEIGADTRIVFTGIHGTGGTVTPRALREWGFPNVSVVEAQQQPDGNFPTVHSPNPEEGAALDLALRQARAEGADLVLGTDPDADRVGIALPQSDGTWRLMSGQEVAVLLTFFVLARRSETGKLPRNGVVIKTIVTTDLLVPICHDFGIELIETLTGFKYIGAHINAWDDEGRRVGPPDRVYLVGGEESYGYLIGTHARDKDAVVACCSIAEMLAWCRHRHETPLDLLDDIHSKFGIYQEDQLAITLEGLTGMRQIDATMTALREKPPLEFGGRGLNRVRDILRGTVVDASGRHLESLDFERENVLELHYGADLKVTARPSGTEPKIKFYLSAADLAGLPIPHGDLNPRRHRLSELLKGLKAELRSFVERIKQSKA